MGSAEYGGGCTAKCELCFREMDVCTEPGDGAQGY